MDLAKDFAFVPLPPIQDPHDAAQTLADVPHVEAFTPDRNPPKPVPSPKPLGPLELLLGTWEGTGLNIIWRPHFAQGADPKNQDRFLEINFTAETLQFDEIKGAIPNRGLLQPDINMFGIRYLQQISDRNVSVGGQKAGLHIEPGVWAIVPATKDPQEPQSVVRMGSIPHGTTILAQGVAIPPVPSKPDIATISIKPFAIGGGQGIDFPEQHLDKPTPFRTPATDVPGLTQDVLDNPNLFLSQAIAHATITETTTLVVSTDHTPIIGGGTTNTAFLVGTTHGPNANAAKVSAIFWIERVRDAAGQDLLQLQYTQTVLLNFNGLSWPHVSVATLRRST